MRTILIILAFSLATLRLWGVEPKPAVLPMPQPTPNVTFAEIEGVETDRAAIPQAKFAAWPHISLKEAQRLHGLKGVVFADARGKVEWDQSHIPGALPAPLYEFDLYYKKYQKRYQKARTIVVYCHGVGCQLSDIACEKFTQKGHKNVVNFYSGWPAWSNSKLPIEDMRGKKVKPTPVPTPKPPVTAMTPNKP